MDLIDLDLVTAVAETMDTYGHLFPDSEELGRGAIDAAVRSVSVRSEGENRRQAVSGDGN